MTTTLLVGSQNQNKVREIREILGNDQVQVVSPKILKRQIDPEETARTFLGNARIKAAAYAREVEGEPINYVIADDSGLCVSILGGEPGIYSARYAGHGCNYEENINKLLREMRGIPLQYRKAQFVCVVSCYSVETQKELFHTMGLVQGFITEEPKGESGFGYDPIFFTGIQTYGEMSSKLKNMYSHRAEAIKHCKHKLSEVIGQVAEQAEK